MTTQPRRQYKGHGAWRIVHYMGRRDFNHIQQRVIDVRRIQILLTWSAPSYPPSFQHLPRRYFTHLLDQHNYHQLFLWPLISLHTVQFRTDVVLSTTR
jgi:hypothetical protein